MEWPLPYQYGMSLQGEVDTTGLSLFLFTPLGSVTRLRLSSCLVSRRLSTRQLGKWKMLAASYGIMIRGENSSPFILIKTSLHMADVQACQRLQGKSGSFKCDINARLIKTKKILDILFDSSVEYKDISRYNKTTVYRAYWKETFSEEEQEIIHHCIICLECDLADQLQGPGCLRGYWIMNDRSSYRYVLCDRNLRHISLLHYIIWIKQILVFMISKNYPVILKNGGNKICKPTTPTTFTIKCRSLMLYGH